MSKFAIALGSNRGDSSAICQQALAALSSITGIEVLDVAPFLLTHAVGGPAGNATI